MTARKYVNRKHLLRYSLHEQLIHGMRVSNLAHGVAKELGMDEEFCHEIAVAGILHDIGKEWISGNLDEKEEYLIVEEIHFVRMHPKAGYDILRRMGYSQRICEMVLYHHENMDGSGYPENLQGDAIPLGARILRICDVYAALTSDRPYRKAFDKRTAMELLIEESKDFDLKVFLAFQRMLHNQGEPEIRLSEIEL